jgi:uncharacterized Tic20 family protein
MESNPGNAPMSAPQSNETQMWNMLCHLIALSGYITGVGFFLGPLIVWWTMKDKFPSVEEHGKESLNFQITVLLAGVAVGVASVVVGFLTFGIGFYVGFAAMAILGGAHLVLVIIASMQAWSGGSYRYPFTLRLIS